MLLAGYPLAVGAQGGDAVFESVGVTSTAADALRTIGGIKVGADAEVVGALTVGTPILPQYLGTGTPTARTWLRGDGTWAGTGFQDAAYDLLTSDLSTSRSNYETIMSASVTVGEAGDAVTVHVTGQIGRSSSLYVVDNTGDDLWRIDDPTNPGAAVLVGSFPSGLTSPGGITSDGASLYVVDFTGDDLWRIDDPTNPGAAVLEGSFPSGLTAPSGITSDGASLYVVDFTDDELWRIDDPTNPGAAVLEGSFPSGLTSLNGITSHAGALYVLDNIGDELWRIDDPTNPGAAVLEGSFPSGLTSPSGITSHGASLYVVDFTDDELWRIDDPTNPGAAVLEGSFPSGLTAPVGITSGGVGPCMIRVARGTTEIEGLELDDGRILFDATFVDAPPVGTHTYSLQMRTLDPNTLCTAYRGDGTVPLPSLFVQSYFGGSP